MRARVVRFGLGVLVLAAAGAPAAAADRPFKGNVTASWDNVFKALGGGTANFAGGGPVTHMGKTVQVGTLSLGAPAPGGLIPGSGRVTITAADGSSVSFTYTGLLNPATGEGQGTFTFTGGTGRFARVSGQGSFRAAIDLSRPANQPMTVVLDGRIDY